MNAMVCGDMTRVRDGQLMIIYRDSRRRHVQGGNEVLNCPHAKFKD
jgi:hypothetical protein